MKATEILMKEHQNILLVLNRLEQLLNMPLDKNMDEYQLIIGFVEEYSDSYHHMKEEDIYFKWIEKHSPSLKEGPVNCMLSEHTTFRDLTANAKNALAAFIENGAQDAQETVVASFKMFIDLLRAHIGKENEMLYQMAERLDERVNCGDEEMLGEYNKVELKYSAAIKRYEEYCSSLGE